MNRPTFAGVVAIILNDHRLGPASKPLYLQPETSTQTYTCKCKQWQGTHAEHFQHVAQEITAHVWPSPVGELPKACSHGIPMRYRCEDCEGWTDMGDPDPVGEPEGDACPSEWHCGSYPCEDAPVGEPMDMGFLSLPAEVQAAMTTGEPEGDECVKRARERGHPDDCDCDWCCFGTVQATSEPPNICFHENECRDGFCPCDEPTSEPVCTCGHIEPSHSFHLSKCFMCTEAEPCVAWTPVTGEEGNP